jgi:Lhr-like helicase
MTTVKNTEIKKETLIVIENDIYGENAEQETAEDINYLVNELNVFCELKNSNYINIVEQEKRYSSSKEDYKKSIQIEAKGYCQSDWQTYTLYYKLNGSKQHKAYLKSLIQHLERSFTHKNNYCVNKYDVVTIDGKEFKGESEDHTTFSITNVEFPKVEDVKAEYLSIYGEDFDKIQININ